MNDLPERALAAVEKYGGWEGVLAALKDAERYRWLRDNGRGDWDILWDYQGEGLDRVIDSEISREKGANA